MIFHLNCGSQYFHLKGIQDQKPNQTWTQLSTFSKERNLSHFALILYNIRQVSHLIITIMLTFNLLVLGGITHIFSACLAIPLIPSVENRQEGSCSTAPCQIGYCCSTAFFCGKTQDYCGQGTCVGGVGGTCPVEGQCCSQYGFCGWGTDYCGTPSTPTAAPSPTPTPTTSPPAPPVNSGTVNQWNQCGGEGWEGGTVCVAPFICTYGGAWWSSCECPGNAYEC